MPRTTPLHDVHVGLGATMTDFAGWAMPLRYSSEIAEHTAVRTAAGLFDLSHMGEIELIGPGAGAALDHALVGRPSGISPGRARYSMICDVSGGILDDLVVYRLAADHYFIVANAANVSTVVHAIEQRSAAFETVVRNTTDEWALIAAQGPSAAGIVSAVVSADVPSLKYYAIEATLFGDVEILLARTGYTGEDGFEIYSRPSDASRIWKALTQAGMATGLAPAGLACRDTLRLEAGMPLYGNELTRDVTPFDAGLDRLVVFDKAGGFIGDAALERTREIGSSKRLVGLVTEGRRVPRHGHAVLDSTGVVVGHVTSGAPSPTLGHPVAMAYVPAGLADPGTPLFVDVRGTNETAQVVPLPFYRRPTN